MINCEESLRFPACLQKLGAGPNWRLPRWCRVWSEEHPGGAVLGSLSLQKAKGGQLLPTPQPPQGQHSWPLLRAGSKRPRSDHLKLTPEKFLLNRTGFPCHQVVKDWREAWRGCRAFSTGDGQSRAGDGPERPVLMLPSCSPGTPCLQHRALTTTDSGSSSCRGSVEQPTVS